MSNGWITDQQLRQSQMIQQWKPWSSAGAKTINIFLAHML